MAMEFNKKDVLAALGMETDTNFWTVALAGFGVGCIVGAAVAMMVAPKSGRELRSDLMEKGRGLVSRGKEEMQSSMNRGGQEGKPVTPTY